MPDSTSHAVIAVALRVGDGRLEVLVAEAPLRRGERLEAALERAVDGSALAHVEQLETRVLADERVATAYLGLARSGGGPAGAWRAVRPREGGFVQAARARLRAKLSYTNLGFALASETFTISELRDLYAAALGHEVSATNLQRVLLRRGVLVATGERRPPGRTGGRPAEVYRFRSPSLEITDQFAVLRPPAKIESA